MVAPKTIAFTFLGAAAALGAGVFTQQQGFAQEPEDLRAWAEAQKTRFESRDHARSPLWGSASKGEAFAVYEAGTAALAEHAALCERVTRELRLPGADPKARADALATLAPALKALRTGAHRGDAGQSIAWDQGVGSQCANLLMFRYLANAAQMQVRERLDAGESLDAVHWLLDTAQMGRDLMQVPILIDQMIGAAMLEIAVEMADRPFFAALSKEALTALDAGLTKLDVHLPVANASVHTEAALLVLGFDVENVAAAEELQSYVHELIAAGKVQVEASTVRWPEAETLYEAFQAQAPNEELTQQRGTARSAAYSRRLAVTMLRLLRVDVAHRQGEVLVLDDPLGAGPLAREDDAGTLRIFSAGQRVGSRLQRVMHP